jgi:1,4-dihydroxy-2-naphthoate octaprenyltransferase
MDASQRELAVRPSSIALWTGIFAGPIAWAAALQIRYAIIQYVCRNHANWILWTVTIAALLVTALGAFCARSRRAEDRPTARFMSTAGLAISGMFALSIIAMAIPDFFLGPCD